jgi:cell division inhibitor SepF
MANFVHKALQYLGLKDIDEEEFYDDEDYEEPERRSGYGAVESSAPMATVRPLVRDENRAYDRQARGVRAFSLPRQGKPQIVSPRRFSDAQEIGDLLKGNSPVIVNLQGSERDLARRMIDFCSGLTYGLAGSMEKVAEHVFLLTPSNVEVPEEERQRLAENGLFRA